MCSSNQHSIKYCRQSISKSFVIVVPNSHSLVFFALSETPKLVIPLTVHLIYEAFANPTTSGTTVANESPVVQSIQSPSTRALQDY